MQPTPTSEMTHSYLYPRPIPVDGNLLNVELALFLLPPTQQYMSKYVRNITDLYAEKPLRLYLDLGTFWRQHQQQQKQQTLQTHTSVEV